MIPEHELHRRLEHEKQRGGRERQHRGLNRQEQPQQRDRNAHVDGEVRDVPPDVMVGEQAVRDGEPGEQDRTEQEVVALPVLARDGVVDVTEAERQRIVRAHLGEVPQLV